MDIGALETFVERKREAGRSNREAAIVRDERDDNGTMVEGSKDSNCSLLK